MKQTIIHWISHTKILWSLDVLIKLYEILLFSMSVAIATTLWLITIKLVHKSNKHSITLNLIPNTWNFDVLFKCYRQFYKTQRIWRNWPHCSGHLWETIASSWTQQSSRNFQSLSSVCEGIFLKQFHSIFFHIY